MLPREFLFFLSAIRVSPDSTWTCALVARAQNDELTVRFLLEEGKLNLCLRQMAAYYEELLARGPRAEWLGAAARELSVGDQSVLDARLMTFEQSYRHTRTGTMREPCIPLLLRL